MSFNVHLLLHVANCVCNWGPLWGYSAYTFEDFYGKLLQMFNGTQKVGNQIVQNYQHLQFMGILTNVLSENNIFKFFKIPNQLLSHSINTKKYCRSEDIVFIGSGKSIASSPEENELCVRYSLPYENPPKFT
jgi:hypothetical protein